MAYTWEKDSEDINRAFAKFSADKAVLIGVYCIINNHMNKDHDIHCITIFDLLVFLSFQIQLLNQ
jgi:hypothetical protein